MAKLSGDNYKGVDFCKKGEEGLLPKWLHRLVSQLLAINLSKDLTPLSSPKYYKNCDILDPSIVQRFAPFLERISVLVFLRLE